MTTSKVATMRDAIAELVRDGDTVAIEGFTHLISFAAGHEIIRQGRRDLILARLTPDLIYDQMIAAGVARKLIFSWLGNRSVVGTGAQVWGPYLLLLAMGMFNVSLGCLASSLTSNQIIAAMMALVLVLGIFFLTMINYIINSSSPLVRDLTAYVAQLDHMDSFSRGIIDTRPLVFYPTFALLVLVMTYHVFQYRRWKL